MLHIRPPLLVFSAHLKIYPGKGEGGGGNLPAAGPQEGHDVGVTQAMQQGHIGLELAFCLEANGGLTSQLHCDFLSLPHTQVDLHTPGARFTRRGGGFTSSVQCLSPLLNSAYSTW